MIPFAVEQIWRADSPVTVSERGSILALLVEGRSPEHHRRSDFARRLSLLPLLEPRRLQSVNVAVA
jgi:hypothetical protein